MVIVDDKQQLDQPKVADGLLRGLSYSSRDQVCPLCGGPVRRIRRRFEDRLVSLFVKMYRYSCNSRACGWEGCLRVKRNTSD
jgi:hypothetical protein